MRKQRELIKVALGSLLAIGLFSLAFLGLNHLGFAIAANEDVELPALGETITVPDILTQGEFPMPDVALVRAQTFHSMQIDERDFIMSMEEAARLGALYIWDMFGERIDGMVIEMTYNWTPGEDVRRFEHDHARWTGMVSLFDADLLHFLQKSPQEMDLLRETEPQVFSDFMELLWESQRFYFAIDARTGARMAINRPHIFQVELPDDPSRTVTREEVRAATDRWNRARAAGEPDPFPLVLTDAEMELYIQLARTYAQRHSMAANVVEVVFESAWPSEFDRDETGVIIAIDFLLSFTAFDDTGRMISIGIFRNEQRLNGLWTGL
ncbi:MAG: hypothetical protein FWC72_04800 [Oscillospiraceae bacterium]|nr:hypothetical protein [Oscillospiraceae bacterium]